MLINVTWNVENALSKFTKQLTIRLLSLRFFLIVTVLEWILLTAAQTNWNFEFAWTAKIFNTKFTNCLKKYQLLLSTFANVCYFFIINAFCWRLLLFFGRLTHLCLYARPVWPNLEAADDLRMGLYTGWSDVTESMATIQSPYCRYNIAQCAELRGEDLSCYLNNIQPVGSWKCPYDH